MKRFLKRMGLAGWILGLAALAPAQLPEVALTEPEILSFLESKIPIALDILTTSRTEDPDAYHQQIREMSALITYYHEVHKRSPEFAESLLRKQYLTIKSQSLSTQIRGMERGADRDARMEELQDLLEEQFELELQKPVMDVQFLEQEVRRLKQLIEQQRQSRNVIVQKRLRAMTGKPEATP